MPNTPTTEQPVKPDKGRRPPARLPRSRYCLGVILQAKTATISMVRLLTRNSQSESRVSSTMMISVKQMAITHHNRVLGCFMVPFFLAFRRW